MRKDVKINGKKHTIKVREEYAPKQKVVPSKVKYNRKTLKAGRSQ